MPRVKPSKDLADRLGALDVLDLEGEPVTVRSLWAEYPLLLVHLRHFG